MELAIICIVESKVKIVCNMGLLQMVSSQSDNTRAYFGLNMKLEFLIIYLFILCLHGNDRRGN